MNAQEKLLKESSWIIKDLNLPALRGVIAEWKGETAHLTFYFDGEPSEEEIDESSAACGEIISRFPSGYLKENYLAFKKPKQLPESDFWVFRKIE